MTLNPGQQQAVYTRGKDLLVSASAGSGKTFSLCRRVLQELLEGDASIDRMLIVTFTRSAASDLVRKLEKELKKAQNAETDPVRKKKLKQQRLLLPTAKISTIDSFCFELIRENFDALGISPRVRIAEETELAKRKTAILRGVYAEMAQGSEREELLALTDALLGAYSDERLFASLLLVYEKTQNLLSGVGVLAQAAEKADLEAQSLPGKGPFSSVLAEENREKLRYYLAAYDELLAFFAPRKEYAAAADALHSDREFLLGALSLCDDLRAQNEYLQGYNPKKLTFPRNKEDPGMRSAAKILRGSAKGFLTKPEKRGEDLDFENSAQLTGRWAQLLSCLHLLLSRYETALTEYKRKNGVLEFSDVERLAYTLLYDPSGEPSALAKRLAEGFDELYIDEYQDVNELQDKIFLALSRKNRFVVGDVKQSIYSFRGAAPRLFASLRDSYPPADEEGEDRGMIFLEENFRSTASILFFVNDVIGPVMRAGREIRYVREDDLKPSAAKEGGVVQGTLPVLCFVRHGDPRWESEEFPSEAVYLAQALRKMIDSGVKGKDIAVLVRKNAEVETIRRALLQKGIRSETNSDGAFFESPEVVLAQALIDCVDNPTKDICLAGAMRSPVFGFTLDDLVRMRQDSDEESLFSVVAQCAEGTGNERCRRVLRFLSDYRRKAREMPADALVFRMMDELMLLPLLTADETPGRAEEIKNNLLAFYDVVRKLSAGGAKDLGKLTAGLRAMREKGRIERESSPGELDDCVRIMTIHGSKGLEFPVCWVYGVESAVFQKGNSGEIDFSPFFGALFPLCDEQFAFLRRRTVAQAAYSVLQKKATINEEIRLLYVALTRAVDKLYVSCTVSEKSEETARSLKDCSALHECILEENASYLKWIYLAFSEKNGPDTFETLENELPVFLPGEEGAFAAEEEKDLPDAGASAELVKLFGQRLDRPYERAAAIDLPAKLAVSRLTPSVLDDEEEPEDSSSEDPDEPVSGLTPSFYAERYALPDYERAAKAGTATHAFMQFCNFAFLEEEGFEKEAARLSAEGFLPPSMLHLVEKRPVMRFLQSDLYAQMKKARRLWRERRFMIALDAARFTKDPERVEQLKWETLLVQGVIDCFFEDENGKIVLFDYKTDHFSAQERQDSARCEKVLLDRHTEQLRYYAEAVESMTGRKVDRCCIYSFSLGKAVEVTL